MWQHAGQLCMRVNAVVNFLSGAGSQVQMQEAVRSSEEEKGKVVKQQALQRRPTSSTGEWGRSRSTCSGRSRQNSTQSFSKICVLKIKRNNQLTHQFGAILGLFVEACFGVGGKLWVVRYLSQVREKATVGLERVSIVQP